MKKLGSLFLLALAVSIRRSLAYRTNLLFDLTQTLLLFMATLIAVLAVTGVTGSVGGWMQFDALVLAGVFCILGGVRAAFIEPSLVSFVDSIRDGRLDIALLEPAPDWFTTSARSYEFLALAQSLLGLILIWVSVANRGLPSPIHLVAGAWLLVCGVAVSWAVSMLVACLGFWAARFDLAPLTYSLWDFGRYPDSAYGGLLGVVVTFVVPVCGIVVWPASALLGRQPGTAVLLGTMFAIGFILLARIALARGLRRYTGATS